MKYLSQRLITLLTCTMLCACGDGMEFMALEEGSQDSLYGVASGSNSPVTPACLLAGPKSLHLEAMAGTSSHRKFSLTNVGGEACTIQGIYILLPPGTPQSQNPFVTQAYINGLELNHGGNTQPQAYGDNLVAKGDTLDIVLTYTPVANSGSNTAQLKIDIAEINFVPLDISATIIANETENDLICGEAITCCDDGLLYPNTCCGEDGSSDLGACTENDNTCNLGGSESLEFGAVESGIQTLVLFNDGGNCSDLSLSIIHPNTSQTDTSYSFGTNSLGYSITQIDHVNIAAGETVAFWQDVFYVAAINNPTQTNTNLNALIEIRQNAPNNVGVPGASVLIKTIELSAEPFSFASDSNESPNKVPFGEKAPPPAPW